MPRSNRTEYGLGEQMKITDVDRARAETLRGWEELKRRRARRERMAIIGVVVCMAVIAGALLARALGYIPEPWYG